MAATAVVVESSDGPAAGQFALAMLFEPDKCHACIVKVTQTRWRYG